MMKHNKPIVKIAKQANIIQNLVVLKSALIVMVPYTLSGCAPDVPQVHMIVMRVVSRVLTVIFPQTKTPIIAMHALEVITPKVAHLIMLANNVLEEHTTTK